MTFCKCDAESNECLIFYWYPLHIFIKYFYDDDTCKEDTEQFGKYIAKLFNKFNYKYNTGCSYCGDVTK